jgi:drug/metabolite transporter (DMT)-like permease
MSWVFFGLLSPLVFTVVNFVDKYIVEKEVGDYRSMPIYAALAAFVTGTVLWVITGFPILPLPNAALVLFTGALNVFAAAFYFRAIALEEASRIIVLIQMQPIIVLVLSFLFLQETIRPLQLLGFGLILAAAIGISLNRKTGGFRLSAAFVLILLVDLLSATSVVLFKFVAEANSFAHVLSYESWGLALGGIILYILAAPLRQAFQTSIKTVGKRTLGFIFVNETFYLVAKLLTFVAVALGPVALVSVLSSTQVFFGIVLGWLLTLLLPNAFNENIARQDLLRKGALALVMFGGLVMVT